MRFLLLIFFVINKNKMNRASLFLYLNKKEILLVVHNEKKEQTVQM